ncbi:hypothetical protein BCS84_09395 [Vibrio cyclitrophicus]|uniref:Uncharacterized protein n=2 Tax=Vibrio cyclitrophicus TaxID=47951 RepID=A0A7Z1MLL7_9VIBR|nr:hypothetical protein [Vibrio cyclitrophicus]OED90187.1 hypothetical protein OAQ_16675 [Vibrio cyclitrophicus ZF30]OEE18307.1 hypothetical protein OC1_05245 [Vibrio cyclitrophicus ZF207]PMJ31514.1 hypothetical protein BCU25_14730 [Vibrio cyclitrophicus]PMP19834.1 hypothetical protein BCS91_23350 [Vibrio cyclitrophicus]PMP31671.1 hypothetical protein BCS90_10165 [Vibrio cyclitrophicus]
MELDFYKGFEYVDSVSVGKELWGDILKIECLDEVSSDESIIPDGFDGEGEKIERISLLEIRKSMLESLSRLLLKNSRLERDENTIMALSKIIEIMKFINSDDISHFKLDV